MTHSSLTSRFRRTIFSYFLLTVFVWTIYYIVWGRHLYLITAYCNCPICINVKKYQDGKFASGRNVYWGGIAADRFIPFKTRIELIPVWPQDWRAVSRILEGRRRFHVEDRGGKIRGKHLDIFIPDSLGGHKAALRWGVRRMRIKINGRWAD